MGLADLVVLAGIEKDALGGRRLTGVDVRHDADVAIFLERMAAGHDLISVAGAPSTPRQFSECLRSEEHTSELQSLMRISYAVFCLKKKKNAERQHTNKK